MPSKQVSVIGNVEIINEKVQGHKKFSFYLDATYSLQEKYTFYPD